MHKTPPSPARRHQLELSAVAASAAGAASCQMPGLTIISTAPRCQMLPLLAATAASQQEHHHVASVETFIGPTQPPPPTSMGITLNNGNPMASACSTLERKSAGKHMTTCLQQQQQQQFQHQHHPHPGNLQSSSTSATLTSITSPRAMRCCNILGGNVNVAGERLSNSTTAGGNCVQQPQHHIAVMPQVVSGSSMGYYDAYGAAATSALNMPPPPPSASMTGSLSRRSHLSATHAQQASSGDYIGAEHLDILQNVAGGK